MNHVRLHVNIDHIATLRNARGTTYPDPVKGAQIALEAGAEGITAHLREDRRHIRDEDIDRIGAHVREAGRIFNLEMAATDEMVQIALKARPDVVTLVPERRAERTTEGGLDVLAVGEDGDALRKRIDLLLRAKLRVSLFIAPLNEQIAAGRKLGVQQVELHTGEYAHAVDAYGLGAPAVQAELARLQTAATFAHELGVEVAAGHGLTRANVPALVAIREIVELNIGHALIADAVFLSLREAVLEFRAACHR
ncbi:MAG: pyridoxine 5'-phosphate synthase [Polyangiaceae bacterium]